MRNRGTSREEQTCRFWFSDEEFREALLTITRGDDVYGPDVVANEEAPKQEKED